MQLHRTRPCIIYTSYTNTHTHTHTHIHTSPALQAYYTTLRDAYDSSAASFFLNRYTHKSHTQTHTQTHTQKHTQKHTHTNTHHSLSSLSFSLTLFLSLSLTHTHTHQHGTRFLWSLLHCCRRLCGCRIRAPGNQLAGTLHTHITQTQTHTRHTHHTQTHKHTHTNTHTQIKADLQVDNWLQQTLLSLDILNKTYSTYHTFMCNLSF